MAAGPRVLAYLDPDHLASMTMSRTRVVAGRSLSSRTASCRRPATEILNRLLRVLCDGDQVQSPMTAVGSQPTMAG